MRKIFTSSFLHILAMILMLCDHLWATIFPYLDWMTCIGRISFPIFAFLIVEGYFHTRSFKKYVLRMLIFAIISEIPFDLVYGDSIFYLFHQNVLWTFLMSLLLIRFLEYVKQKDCLWKYILASIAAVIVGGIVGTITMVDYYGAGIICVLIFYFLRKRTLINAVLQFLLLYYVFVELIGGYYYPVTILGHYFELQQETIGLFALIPIWLYNGAKGYNAKWFKYMCYAFYPVHLLVVYVCWQLVLNM